MKTLPITQFGFIILTIIYFALLLKELRTGIQSLSWDGQRKKGFFNRIIFVLLAWMLFVSIWSYSGMMADFSFFPFNFLPVILIPLIALLVLTFSSSFTSILKHIPAERLIRLQSFRIVVEIFLWMLFLDNIVPVQMTFEGRNFDILIGLTAPLIAWMVVTQKISRTGLIIWNIIGLLILFNIVTIAMLSTPSPIRVFMNEPANTIVAQFPVSWLPGFLVPLAYGLHCFSLRQLLSSEVKKSVLV